MPFAPSSALAAGQVRAAEDAHLIVNRCLDAWNDHDADTAGVLLDRKAQCFNSATTTETDRPEDCDKIVMAILKAMPDLQLERVRRAVSGPRSIAFEWELTGHRPITTGQRPVKIRGASIIKIQTL